MVMSEIAGMAVLLIVLLAFEGRGRPQTRATTTEFCLQVELRR